MNVRWHAARARALVEACGGLQEAALHCRVSRSVLSDYGNPQKACAMPADVILALEEYCGQAFYTHALSQASHGVLPVDDLVDGSISISVQSSALVQAVRDALRDGELSESECRQLDGAVGQIRRELAAIDALINKSGAAS